MKTKVISIFVAVCMLLAAAAVSLTVANAADATADGQTAVAETAAPEAARCSSGKEAQKRTAP